ncbi:hypothetical protein [Streptomyces sp. Z26]|uniref:zinc finger domain-containing protein n=1 Tax=Streptomyces sp. Z26 TaxID=2500177 RepID=UPI000EF14A01|nr:hypothetical protein [Streptomyces sp. Z26]RLL66972.1 hypothetical protein D7M15_08940 [Streptomyces sp. Z26]
MTPSEAAKLLGNAAAFDNRTVGEADARAWAAALHDVPGDPDAFAAVARYYGTAPVDGRRLWIEPHHVRALRKTIRDERHGETIPAYDSPDPQESGDEFVQRRREQLRAIGDGRLTPTPVRQLGGGPHPSVAPAIANGVRTVNATLDGDDGQPRPYMPEEIRRASGLTDRPPELLVACPEPYCRADARRPCVTPRGKRRTTTHQARQRAAQQTAGGA